MLLFPNVLGQILRVKSVSKQRDDSNTRSVFDKARANGGEQKDRRGAPKNYQHQEQGTESDVLYVSITYM